MALEEDPAEPHAPEMASAAQARWISRAICDAVVFFRINCAKKAKNDVFCLICQMFGISAMLGSVACKNDTRDCNVPYIELLFMFLWYYNSISVIS
ncbi:hypothetical protein BRADI_1g58102v3 [Brachypodium distachyon]|uniref:Uncharacterized protein n=1 Tax=Brachypodium distachyon TaxID=15368 RepID=A0A2K2DS71_BRADI|nr:hypothetical protein BRADI_1g58102v3 [Brachypodium distachyon]